MGHLLASRPPKASRKVMRKNLGKIAGSDDKGLGDVTTLSDPEAVGQLSKGHKASAK